VRTHCHGDARSARFASGGIGQFGGVRPASYARASPLGSQAKRPLIRCTTSVAFRAAMHVPGPSAAVEYLKGGTHDSQLHIRRVVPPAGRLYAEHRSLCCPYKCRCLNGRRHAQAMPGTHAPEGLLRPAGADPMSLFVKEIVESRVKAITGGS